MDAKNSLLPENRDKIIGVKVTQTEYNEIKAYCDKKCVNVSRYVRYLIKNDLDSK